MYIPKHFNISDIGEAVMFMRRYSFATLINVSGGLPVATHLPFVVEQHDERVVLYSHLAKANTQSADLLSGNSLVIFTEPHAYIAPKLYEKELNVPTWNYIAVHAYGEAQLIEDEPEQLLELERMITSYDAGYLKQWSGLPLEYKLKLCKGIMMFKITVTDLQGKKKLSQNRTDNDRQSIINAFSHSTDANEQTIAGYMVQDFNRNK
jgi:transcriptional regulator